jgi:hypothetical protein
MPENTIYVGRGSRWGNSWKIGSNRYDAPSNRYFVCETVEDTIAAFRQSIDWHPGLCQGYGPIHRNRQTARIELVGKNLACWCPLDRPCHADVLLEIANSPAEDARSFGFGYVIYESELS